MTCQRMRLAAALALALLAQGAAYALETGFEFRSSNLQFPWSQVEPLASSVKVFPWNNFFWGGEAWFSESMGEDASFRISYERDPVLRNSLSAAVQFERGIARIEVGPRLGLFNTTADTFSAGLSSAVRLQWPGVAYVSMRSDGGLALGVLASAADPQARVELAAGVYVPNAIVSAVLEAKRFNELDSAGAVVTTDSWTRYAIEVDIYKKNVPYTLLGSLGYEQRSKTYAAADLTDSLGSIVLGTKATARFSPYLSLSLDLDTSFYVFGLDELVGRGPASSSFMFSAGLGATFDVDEFRTSRAAKKVAREAARENSDTTEPTAREPGNAQLETDTNEVEGNPTEAATLPAPLPIKAWSLNGGAGIDYNIAALPSGAFAILTALYNVRGGGWVGLDRDLGHSLAAGAEAGLQYVYASSGGSEINIFNLPIRAALSYRRGMFGAKAFAGLLASGSFGSSSAFDLGFGLEGGARLKIGPLYVEGSYVYGLEGMGSFPRAGLGYCFDLATINKKGR